MKPKLYLAIFCSLFFSLAGWAQNWKTVRLNDTTWYAQEPVFNGPFRTFHVCWLDSFQTTGVDTTFYFYKSLRDSASLTDCIDSLGPSWLGKQFVRLANGDELYFNGINDTIRIKTLAAPGDSWTLYENTSGESYIATVQSVGTMVVDGVMDSIKTIMMLAHQGTTPVMGWYNDKWLVLSKNHGWVKPLDMFCFKNTAAWSNVSAVADKSQYERLQKKIGDINVKDQKPFAKFQPGNEWISKEFDFHSSMTPSVTYNIFTHDSVMATQAISSDALQVTMRTIQYKWTYHPSGNIIHDTNYVHTDTVYADTSNYLVKYQILPDFNWNLQFLGSQFGVNNRHYMKYTVDTTCGDRYVFDAENVSPVSVGLLYNNGCMQVTPSVSETQSTYWRYMEGFGNIIHEQRYHQAAMFTKNTNYLYVKLGGCELGTKMDVAALDVHELPGEVNSLLLYPTPANTTLSIKGLANGKHATLSISDMIGRKLTEVKDIDAGDVIDISALPFGCYVAQIVVNGHTRFQKIVVAH